MERRECLEQCRGTILNAEKLPGSVRDEEGFAQFVADYETYKDPDNVSDSYPDSMKGKRDSC